MKIGLEIAMNKPTIVGSVTLVLGVGWAIAADPCGVVQNTHYCEAGGGDGTRCWQPSANSDGCSGTATNFCVTTSNFCDEPMLSFNSADRKCYPTSAAHIPYTTYSQGPTCTPPPTTS